MAMKAILARRFAPLNFSAIEDYPHPVPLIDEWKDLLPRFYEGKDDNPIEHVHEFHNLMQQLDIHHEDILMKMFMYSLDGDARKWYFSLPPSNISSLKDFHRVFNEHCKRFYPSESICHNCCEGYVECAQDLLDCSAEYKDENDFIHCPNESIDEDLESMDDEDLFEALYHFSSQVYCHDDQGMLVVDEINEEMIVDSHDLSSETNNDSSAPLCTTNENIQHHGQSAEEKENNCCFIQRKHRLPPPLTEEEIDQLLNSYVTAPAYTDLQHSHSPEHVSETSSITENENLSLNDDSHGTLQEVSKAIYDDDFCQRISL
jgi:hypothetical protein